MKKILIKCIVLYSLIGNLYSQNKTIKGRIIDERLELLPMVSILNNYNVEIGKTDINGFFQIEIPISENKLLLSDTGLEPLYIELTNKCNEIEVIMILSGSYDFKTLKKADRLRMKRFKKLPKLHKEAFEKGIFNTDKACYSQGFILYCKR